MSDSHDAKVLLLGGCSTCLYYYKSKNGVHYGQDDDISPPIFPEACKYADAHAGKNMAYPFEDIPKERFCNKWKKPQK